MDRPPKRFFEFGPFRIDGDERQLLRDGSAIPLTPKVFDLLLTLVENRGHTIEKSELMSRIWADTFVEDNNLSRNISTLRKLLGDDLHDSRFIKTVPKRGYRFEPDVHEIFEDQEELVVEHRTNYSLSIGDRSRNDRGTSKMVSRYRTGLALLVTGVLIAGLVWAFSAGAGENELRGAKGAETFELYTRGRSLWQNRSAAGLHEATLLLEQAVEKDPGFALGHAALADAYAFDTGNWKKAEETANRSVQLDPNLGEPHASIGFVKFFWEWNPAAAETHFKRALALNPDYSTAHHWYSLILVADGRHNQALAEINRAVELDPDSVAINADMCRILYFLQRYDDAEAQCKKTLEMDGNFFSARLYLFDIYIAKGMYDQAFGEFLKSEQLSANYSALPADLEKLKTAYERSGIEAFWRAQIEMGKKPNGSCGYATAMNHARLGDNDAALNCLQQAYLKRDFNFPFFFAEPVFRNCCFTHPQYLELQALWANHGK